MRLGTRGSALALAQAHAVARALGGGVELVEIATSGDRGARGGDKERWVKELEVALLAGEIDLAVHSAKDVPGELPEGLALAGAPAREDPVDVLCGAPSLAALGAGARVGTSSLRRAAQVLAARPEVEVVEMRGNVDTRLRKLADGEVEALVLASAGLTRLGLSARAGGSLHDFVPAPGQGVIALEAREGDTAAWEAARGITDGDTWTALLAERALAAGLSATCRTPLGAHALVGAQGVVLRSFVGLPDGSAWLRDEAPRIADPVEAGLAAAERLLAAGARELLDRAEELAG